MRLLLIRHGESSANAEKRLQGHVDFPLNDRGRRGSELLADRLCRLSIDALYTSPLKRALETAEIVAARLGLPPEERADLMERDVGELGGLTRDEIRARYPDYVRARAGETVKFEVPGLEPEDDFLERVRRIIATIIESHAQQTAAAVTHGGVIGAFVRETLRMPAIRPAPFDIGNTSITTFEVIDSTFDVRVQPRVRLIGLNDTCHLDGVVP